MSIESGPFFSDIKVILKSVKGTAAVMEKDMDSSIVCLSNVLGKAKPFFFPLGPIKLPQSAFLSDRCSSGILSLSFLEDNFIVLHL